MNETAKAPPQHHAVVHPGALAKGANNWAAVRLAALYGAAATIWLFAAYSVLGAVFVSHQVTLLYWSNAAQLVFCPLMTYVGNQLGKQQAAKADADHASLTHIATVVDRIDQRTGGS